jgi:ABC-type glycerol-3-phosphate transport system substrate-binding protein
MKIRMLGILALASLAATAACSKGDNSGDTTQNADTTVVGGQDTVQKTVNEVVPTQDTVVKTTTTDVDTTKGNATDTSHAVATDTTKKM